MDESLDPRPLGGREEPPGTQDIGAIGRLRRQPIVDLGPGVKDHVDAPQERRQGGGLVEIPSGGLPTHGGDGGGGLVGAGLPADRVARLQERRNEVAADKARAPGDQRSL